MTMLRATESRIGKMLIETKVVRLRNNAVLYRFSPFYLILKWPHRRGESYLLLYPTTTSS